MNRVTNGHGAYDNVAGLKVSSRVTAIRTLNFISIFARGRDGAAYANRLDLVSGRWTGWQNLGRLADQRHHAHRHVRQQRRDRRPGRRQRRHGQHLYPLSGRATGWRSLGGGLTSNIAAHTLTSRVDLSPRM